MLYAFTVSIRSMELTAPNVANQDTIDPTLPYISLSITIYILYN